MKQRDLIVEIILLFYLLGNVFFYQQLFQLRRSILDDEHERWKHEQPLLFL